MGTYLSMLGGAGGGSGGGGFEWEPVGEQGVWPAAGARTQWWYGATTPVDLGDTVFLENELLAIVGDTYVFWVYPGHHLNQLDSAEVKPITGESAKNTAIQFAFLTGTTYFIGRTADDELVIGSSNFRLTGNIRLWRTNSQIIVPA